LTIAFGNLDHGKEAHMGTQDATHMCVDNPSQAGPNSATHLPSDSQLFRFALLEAEKHKWIESQKAGRDLGIDALKDWSRLYWWRWCRERWVEHLGGVRFWSELDQHDFGLLNRDFHKNVDLVQAIVTRIKKGGENLDIIQWAQSSGQSMDDTLEILKLLDINSRRKSFWPS
jgi:hypothetical protein